MGVVGAGKTTVGSLLAKKLGWRFADADDFHPAANVEKIRNGMPLDDSDRVPWLAALRTAILQWNVEGQDAVLACSALKRKYRDVLRVDGDRVVVSNVNLVKRHTKPNPQANQPGGIVEREASIHISNVQLFNSATNKGERAGTKTLEDGRKVRVFRSGEVVDA